MIRKCGLMIKDVWTDIRKCGLMIKEVWTND